MTDREALTAEEEATLRAALGHFQDEPNGRLIGRLLATLDRERAGGVRLGDEGLERLRPLLEAATPPHRNECQLWDDTTWQGNLNCTCGQEQAAKEFPIAAAEYVRARLTEGDSR